MSNPDRSKIGKSNVRKSKTHERRVAHLLTDWSGIEFRRRRVEGRDATVVERESTADVIPIKGTVHCSIEAKSGRNFSLDALLANCQTALFTTWWHQATYDCTILNEVFKREFYPMVFFKPHANFDWVAIDQKVFTNNILKPLDGHQSLGSIWFPSLAFNQYERVGPITMDVSHSKKNKDMRALTLPSLYFCRWKDFATYVDPKSFFIENI